MNGDNRITAIPAGTHANGTVSRCSDWEHNRTGEWSYL